VADVAPVARNFDRGFQSDTPRDQLPPGVAYRMVDWIPLNGSPLRKRGGWSYATKDLNSVSACSRIEAVAWAPFPGDPHLICLSDNGKVFNVKTFDGTAGSLVSTAGITAPTHPPFWHRDRMIMPAPLGAAVTNPKKYTDAGGGSYAVADVGGTPPQFTSGFSFGDYLVGMNGTVSGTRYANRAWWSPAGLPDGPWTPSTSYWDFPEEIIGGMTISSLQMFFGYTGVHELIGLTPPPGGDFSLRRYVFSQGCFDVRSIVRYKDSAIWANDVGIWRSDGSVLADLTEQGGISLFWQALVANFNYSQGWKASAGLYRGYYFITIYNSSGSLVTSLACDLDRRIWFEAANLAAQTYSSRPASAGTTTATGAEEMFFGWRGGARSGMVSSLWAPSSANANDADGTPVTPVLETPFFKLGFTFFKRIRKLYLNYKLESSGSPALQVSYVDSPESTSYTVLGSLAKTAGKMLRRPLQVKKKVLGIGFKIQQTAASDDTRLHELEIEGHPFEGSY
jgi:hypothetical protein